jgi:hypothetical protein
MKTSPSVATPQDEIPTVRPPPRSSKPSGEPDVNGLRRVPLPASLWELAAEVMRAEADEALSGSRR